jgi:hypothetical protein
MIHDPLVIGPETSCRTHRFLTACAAMRRATRKRVLNITAGYSDERATRRRRHGAGGAEHATTTATITAEALTVRPAGTPAPQRAGWRADLVYPASEARKRLCGRARSRSLHMGQQRSR